MQGNLTDLFIELLDEVLLCLTLDLVLCNMKRHILTCCLGCEGRLRVVLILVYGIVLLSSLSTNVVRVRALSHVVKYTHYRTVFRELDLSLSFLKQF